MDLEKAWAEAAAGAAPASLAQARSGSRAREALRERLDDLDIFEGLLACEAGLSAMSSAEGVRVDWSPGSKTFFTWSPMIAEQELDVFGASELGGGSPCGERPLPLLEAMSLGSARRGAARREANAALEKLASVAEALERRSSLSTPRVVELAKGAGICEICEAFGVPEWGAKLEEARCLAACAATALPAGLRL